MHRPTKLVGMLIEAETSLTDSNTSAVSKITTSRAARTHITIQCIVYMVALVGILPCCVIVLSGVHKVPCWVLVVSGARYVAMLDDSYVGGTT